MAEIRPFKGLLYNQQKIKDIKNVVAPPYDIISENDRDNLYSLNEHNIIRLILGKEFSEDTAENNRYTRASDFLKSWREEGILYTDSNDSIYVYDQEYTFKGINYLRRGFIARVKVEDYEKKVILPHEKTLSKPKDDRLNLLRACKTNLSQIFLIYSDTENIIDMIMEQVDTEDAIIDFKDDEGIAHRVTPIKDMELIKKVVALMKDKKLYIADGHHRYETALAYRREMESSREDSEGQYGEYVMGYFANMDSKGTTIFPTHRLVKNLDSFFFDSLKEDLKGYFDVETIEIPDKYDRRDQVKGCINSLRELGKATSAFGLYFGNMNFYIFHLRESKKIIDTYGNGQSHELTLLDVNILHKIVFNDIIGMDQESVAKQKHIVYEIDEIEAVRKVDEGLFQAAFFLNPTKIESLRKIVNAGEKMPQKSTYFYPKLKTGLVMNMI